MKFISINVVLILVALLALSHINATELNTELNTEDQRKSAPPAP